MIMKANKQIGFIYKNNESIDKIIKDGEVVFERGFLREKTSITLPITFGGVGKDLKDYRVYGNTYQNSTSGKNICLQANIIDTNTIRFDINSNGINQTFTLSLIPPLSVNSMSIVAFADGVNLRSVGTINLISGERSTTTITLTESIYNTIQNASEVHFNLYKSGAGISTTSIIEEPQIENNSSFTSYEPYTGGQPSPNPDYPQEIISCGDLIIDSQDENYGKYKIPVNVRSENLCNGNLTQGQYRNGVFENDINRFTTDFLEVTPSTQYNFSLNSNDNLASLINLAYFDENKNFLGTRSTMGLDTFSNTDRDKTITTTNETYYLRWTLRPYGSKSSISYEEAVTQKLQFEKGNKTLYQPYYNETINIYLDEPLRKIDGYSDYIDFINGKVVRNIKEMDMSIITDWRRDNNYQYYRIGFVNTYGIRNGTLMSNVFIYKTGTFVGDNTFGISSLGNLWLQLPTTSTQNKDTISTYLESIGAMMIGVLETPTEESITLPNIPTVEGNNTLNIETEITPSQVYIKYKSNT